MVSVNVSPVQLSQGELDLVVQRALAANALPAKQLLLELTDRGVALGALAAAQFGPVLLLGAFAGLVADRSDKRRLLLVVQTGAMAQSSWRTPGWLRWRTA